MKRRFSVSIFEKCSLIFNRIKREVDGQSRCRQLKAFQRPEIHSIHSNQLYNLLYEFTVPCTTHVRGLRNTHETCRFCVGGCAMAHPGDEVGDEDSGLRTEDKRRHTTGLARTIDEKKDGPYWKRFPNDRR